MDGDSRFIINVACGIILSRSLSVKLFYVEKIPEIKWLLGVYMSHSILFVQFIMVWHSWYVRPH